MQQIFELPFVQRSVNRWTNQHPMARAREKVKVEEMTKACLISQGARLIKGPVSIEFKLVFPVNRKRDIDNYVSKFVIDALKGTVITDDNSSIVQSLSVTFEVIPKCKEHTILTVTPLEVG